MKTLERPDVNLSCWTVKLENGGEFVLLLNNDTIVSQNFLNHLMDNINILPNIGLLGPKIFHHDDPQKIWFVGGMKSSWTNELVDLSKKGHNSLHEKGYLRVDFLYGRWWEALVQAVFQRLGIPHEHIFPKWREWLHSWSGRNGFADNEWRVLVGACFSGLDGFFAGGLS